MKRMAHALGALFAVALLVPTVFGESRPHEPPRQTVRVTHVVDGDTLRFEGVGPRIRLWGIDAPEKNEPGGSAASAAMVRLVKGLIVSYIEVDRDRYRRIVARVFLPDGRELNRVMLEHGVAREYCRYSKGFYGMCPSKVRVRHSRLH